MAKKKGSSLKKKACSPVMAGKPIIKKSKGLKKS